MAKKISLLLLILFFRSIVLAASWELPPDDTFSVRTGFQTPGLEDKIQNNSGLGGPTVDYKPNAPTKIALGINYKSVGVTIGFATPVSSESKDNLGSTDVTDFQFRFFREQNTFDVFYQKYIGFYVDNTADFNQTLGTNSAKLKRPDISIEHEGFQYFYTLSPENIHLGTFDQSVIPKESGGSLLLVGALNHYDLAGSSPFVPSSSSTGYGLFRNFQGGEFTTLRAGAGGAYVLVWRSFYLAGLLTFTLGTQHQQYSLLGETTDRWRFSSGSNAKLRAGYNTEKYFVAVALMLDSSVMDVEDANINLSTAEASIWFGWRF